MLDAGGRGKVWNSRLPLLRGRTPRCWPSAKTPLALENRGAAGRPSYGAKVADVVVLDRASAATTCAGAAAPPESSGSYRASGGRLQDCPAGARQVGHASRFSETWMFSQLPRCSIDSARADSRLPASISRAGISLRRRGT